MALVNYNEILKYAKKHRMTVGAFNSLNMETLQAVVSAADKMNAPLIVQTYHAHVDYAGADYMRAIAEIAFKKCEYENCYGTRSRTLL